MQGHTIIYMFTLMIICIYTWKHEIIRMLHMFQLNASISMLVYECFLIMLILCKSSNARLTPEVLQQLWYSWLGLNRSLSHSSCSSHHLSIACLTKFELGARDYACMWSLKQSCSICHGEQLLFLGHELIMCIAYSFGAHKNHQITKFNT